MRRPGAGSGVVGRPDIVRGAPVRVIRRDRQQPRRAGGASGQGRRRPRDQGLVDEYAGPILLEKTLANLFEDVTEFWVARPAGGWSVAARCTCSGRTWARSARWRPTRGRAGAASGRAVCEEIIDTREGAGAAPAVRAHLRGGVLPILGVRADRRAGSVPGGVRGVALVLRPRRRRVPGPAVREAEHAGQHPDAQDCKTGVRRGTTPLGALPSLSWTFTGAGSRSRWRYRPSSWSGCSRIGSAAPRWRSPRTRCSPCWSTCSWRWPFPGHGASRSRPSPSESVPRSSCCSSPGCRPGWPTRCRSARWSWGPASSGSIWSPTWWAAQRRRWSTDWSADGRADQKRRVRLSAILARASLSSASPSSSLRRSFT